MDKVREQDLFENWLAHMDDALDAFMRLLPAELRPALDYSPVSLDRLEAFLLERYPSVAAIKADPEPYLDGASRYAGEVFRRTLAGHWRISLDDPRYVYYGLPELTFRPEKDTPICPITLVGASLHRRTGVFLSTVLANAAGRFGDLKS
jgi:hypothetical protein